MASRIEQLAEEHARKVVLPRWLDSYVAGEGLNSFLAGARAVLEEAKEHSDDFGVNKPYVLLADLEALFAEQTPEEKQHG